MPSTEPRTPPPPFEITENIIQLYLGGPYTFPDSHPPSDLAPLLLVCKAWHEYGERQLYRSISIIEDSDDSEAIGVVLLSATLSQNSRLANLVRFFIFETECFGDEHVRAITQIISLSSNLTHLCMVGLQKHIDSRVADRLKHALTKRSLKHFQLHWFSQSDPLYSPKETLALMANWPDLEEVSILHESDSQDPFEFPRVRCLALRRVKVRDLNIACVVAKMAPFVEDADITLGNLVDMEDLACLHTWSETLTRLTLYIVRGDSGEIRYFPPLRKLRYFYCETPVVHPRCLESMDSLEELFYCMLPKQAKQFVDCFREGAGSGDFLPALKVFRFRPYLPAEYCKRREILWMEPLRTALKPFEEICAQRSISFSAYDDEEYY